MSIFEYDEERELKLIRRAEYEEGLKEGREDGLKEGRENGLKDGLKQGRIATLKNLVAKKLAKGWSPAQIAEDLEMELPEVEKLTEEITDSQKQ